MNINKVKFLLFSAVVFSHFNFKVKETFFLGMVYIYNLRKNCVISEIHDKFRKDSCFIYVVVVLIYIWTGSLDYSEGNTSIKTNQCINEYITIIYVT